MKRTEEEKRRTRNNIRRAEYQLKKNMEATMKLIKEINKQSAKIK